MNRYLSFIIVVASLVFFTLAASAQSRIHGIIADNNGQPVANATVLLLNPPDSSLVKGTMTSNSGLYFFDNIPAGSYFISSSSAGYSPVNTALFQINASSENIDQGILKMEPLATTLSNITVTAKRPLYEQKPDRLTINVENSITSAGNTALQVLERSPGVVVNRQSNTIAMLGKEGVNVMINGKLSYMPAAAIVQMLDGLPAGNIDKIELITTPPANFDAEGKAGYINIVLKQNDNVGTNGSFSVTAGYGKGWVTQANLNFNHRQGKINIYGDFSWSRVKALFPAKEYSRISNDGDIWETRTDTDRGDTTRNHTARLGIDYQLSSKSVIGILFTSNGRWYRQAENAVASLYLNSQLDTLSKNTNSELNNWQDYGVNINFQQSFRKEGLLSLNGYYLHYSNKQPFNYYSQYFDKTRNFIYDETTRNGKITPLNFRIGALDYSKKLSSKVNMEAGLKGTIADFSNELNFERLQQGNWTQDPDLSSKYVLKENYSAAYLSLNVNFNEKTSMKAGLRYEYTNSNLGTATTKNIVDRHYGRLFPTFYISRKLSEKSTVNLAYNSRITRPTFNDLAPFTYYGNRYSVLTGNPALQPAISHAVTAGYTFKKYFLQASYTHEKNSIAFFQPTVDSVTRKTISKAENLANQKFIALVISIPVTLTNWWSMQYNITGTWVQTNSIYKGEPVRLEQKNFSVNMTQAFTLPAGFSLELAGFYQSKNLNGITVFKAFGSLDFGARKKISERDNISFSASNLFNSMDFRGYTNLPEQNVVGSINLRFSWRTYKLTYTRSFGKIKLKSNRSRTTGAEDEKGRIQY